MPQQLPDNAYVALQEIGYVNSFCNVTMNKNSLTIFDMLYEIPAEYPKLNPNPYPIYGAYFNCPLKEGFYDSPQELCDMINGAIRATDVSQTKDKTIFSYDPVRVTLGSLAKTLSTNLAFSTWELGIFFSISLWSREAKIGLSREERRSQFSSSLIFFAFCFLIQAS